MNLLTARPFKSIWILTSMEALQKLVLDKRWKVQVFFWGGHWACGKNDVAIRKQ